MFTTVLHNYIANNAFLCNENIFIAIQLRSDNVHLLICEMGDSAENAAPHAARPHAVIRRLYLNERQLRAAVAGDIPQMACEPRKINLNKMASER